MYESPEKITLALWFGSKIIDESGQFIYKPFPTLQHMQHEAFAFAYKYNFLDVFGYEKGEYMPYSQLVEQGIKDNFIYNPVFDYYEAKIDYDKEFDEWIEKNPKYRSELYEIRERCEIYTAQELYLIFYEHEKDYIKYLRKPDSNYNKYKNQINKTLKGMLYEYMGNDKKILNEKYNRLDSMFEKLI